MSEKIFFGKQKNDDRDCCFYIDKAKFECEHYFHTPSPHGPCFSSSFKEDGEYSYNNIRTVLTKKEYDQFIALCNELDSFGSCLDKPENAEKLKLAQAKCDELNKFIDDHLCSDKAKKFADKIKQEEIEYMKEEYDLDDKDIEDIYDGYYYEGYFDRGIINYVYNEVYDIAEEYIDNYNVDDWIKQYINFDQMGSDIVSDGDYVELSDGRVVSLNC